MPKKGTSFYYTSTKIEEFFIQIKISTHTVAEVSNTSGSKSVGYEKC